MSWLRRTRSNARKAPPGRRSERSISTCRSLATAIDHLRCDDLALRYLVRVARTRHERCQFGQPVIAEMNDRCGDFGELRDRLGEARALATADLWQSTL
jgi:hypothetical protein